MSALLALNELSDMPRTPAADVKKNGWRGLMKSVARVGRVVVTNHSEPEAVVISIAEYTAMQQALAAAQARSEPALEALRQRFDERLASLQTTDAARRLRGVMKGPARLGGKVKAGASY